MTTDTDTLVALAAQITPGEWRVRQSEYGEWLSCCRGYPVAQNRPDGPRNMDAIALLPELLAEAIANRARIEALEAEVARWKSRGDNHWETMRCIYRIATEEGDMQAVIQHIKDAGSGYTERPEETLRRYQTELATALAQLTEARAGEDELAAALDQYANPDLYRSHPHGLAFDRRDKSYIAIAALASHAKRKEGR